jgi:hypothetical protein
MNTYTCENRFTSSRGKSYSYGDEIDQNDYDRLSASEQLHFKKNSSTSFSSGSSDDNQLFGTNTSGSIAMGDMLGTGIPGGMDMDFTTPL